MRDGKMEEARRGGTQTASQPFGKNTCKLHWLVGRKLWYPLAVGPFNGSFFSDWSVTDEEKRVK